MKYFLNLIEQARAGNVFEKKDGAWMPSALSNTDWDRIENCRPFVFGATIKNATLKESKTIDAPFETFSIESIKDIEMDEGDPEKEKGFVPLICYDLEKNNSGLFPICVITTEVGPGNYDFIVYSCAEEKTRDVEIPEFAVFKCSNDSYITTLISNYMSRIPSLSLGQETVRESVKIGTANTKRRIRINKLIHIAPNNKENYESQMGKKIDWSHRWLVRGHWRKIGIHKLGKNRSGQYCIIGNTWVEDHEKGPEKMPLVVDKVRLITGQQEVQTWE